VISHRPYPGVEARGAAMRITFYFNRRRCRETLALFPTPTNLELAARLREEIRAKIAIGAFDYASYFPKSRRGGKERLPLKQVPTFKELCARWLKIKREECQLSTFGSYEDALRKHFIPALGNRPVDAFIYSELALLVSNLDCKSTKTRNNILTPLRGVFELALRDGLISDNPVRHIRNRRVQKDLPAPFSREEMESILNELNTREEVALRNYFEFAFTTGLRTSELIALRWSDVDFVGKVVQVNQARVRRQIKATKTYRSREIELTSRALKVLQRQALISFKNVDLDSCVFLDPTTGCGFMDDRVQRERYWYPILDALGIRRRPAYNTRHTFATLSLLAGANPNWISHQLGHTNMKLLLDTYSRWIDGSDAGGNRAKLDALFADLPSIDLVSRLISIENSNFTRITG
jgi:integrase